MPDLDPAFTQWLSTWGLPETSTGEIPPPVAQPLEVQPPAPAAIQPGLSIPAPIVEQAIQSLPPPDATSGVDAQPPPMPPPVEPMVAQAATDQPAPEQSPYFDPLSTGSWSQPIAAPDLVDMGRRDPLAFAQHRQAMEDQQAQVAAEQKAQIDAQNAMRAEQEFNDLKAANAKAAKLQEEIANTEIDPGGRRGTGQRILDVVAVMIGGLVQARRGGPNVAMQIIDSQIDRDIEAQKSNLLGKQNQIAELRQRGMTDFQAQQAYRVAWYGRALDGIKTEMQNYDPRGTAAMRMAQQALELEGRMRMAAEAARKSAFDDELKIRKEQREDEKNAREWIATQDSHNAALKKMGAGSGVGPKYPPEYFAAQGLPAPPAGVLFTEGEYDKWRQRGGGKSTNDAVARKQEADAQEAEAKAAAAKTGYQIKNPETGQVFTKKDGTPLVEMNDTKRNKISDVVVAATRMRSLADKIKALRKKNGGNWKALGSAEAAEMQSLVSQIDFETFKAFGLGAPSEGDKALAEGVRGGIDPSSFVKDASAGFLAYADGLEEKANTELRSSGYDGPRLRFKRADDLPSAKASMVDEIQARAMKTDYTPPTTLATAAAAATPQGEKINSSYENDVKGLAAQAEFSTDESIKSGARAALEQLAKGHPTEAGRALAAQALKELPGSGSVRDR